MKGDIGFVGFMLTADEWQQLDPQSRAQLIAVATRRADPFLEPPRRMPEGTGKHEVIDVIDDELDDLLEPDVDEDAGETEPPDHDAVADGDVAADDELEDFEDWAEL